MKLNSANVLGLQTFGSLLYLELHFRALIQRAIAARLNGRKMDEHIVPAGALDESVALRGVKPLHCAFFLHATRSPNSIVRRALGSQTKESGLSRLAKNLRGARKQTDCFKLRTVFSQIAFVWSSTGRRAGDRWPAAGRGGRAGLSSLRR